MVMTLAQKNLILFLTDTETDSLNPIVVPFRQGCHSPMFAQAIRKLEPI